MPSRTTPLCNARASGRMRSLFYAPHSNRQTRGAHCASYACGFAMARLLEYPPPALLIVPFGTLPRSRVKVACAPRGENRPAPLPAPSQTVPGAMRGGRSANFPVGGFSHGFSCSCLLPFLWRVFAVSVRRGFCFLCLWRGLCLSWLRACGWLFGLRPLSVGCGRWRRCAAPLSCVAWLVLPVRWVFAAFAPGRPCGGRGGRPAHAGGYLARGGVPMPPLG